MGLSRLGAIPTLVGVALFAMASRADAQPCGGPADCVTNFCVDGVCCDVACTEACRGCSAAAKGGGEDGTCGLVPAGTVCEPSHCGGIVVTFYPAAVCDAAGGCAGPTPVSCVLEEPCKFDLCDPGEGCDQVTMIDGTSCGGEMVCTSGVCGPSMSASSSGAGGAGGAGGAAGGAGGDPALGGAGATPPQDYSDLYPPATDDGCGCRVAGVGAGGFAAALMGALGALLAVRLRRRRA